MKKLLLISTLISLITLPVLAHDANRPHKCPEQPEVRRHEALSEEFIPIIGTYNAVTSKPVIAEESNYAGGETDRDPQSVSNCFEVNKDGSRYRFCAYDQEDESMYEIDNTTLYKDCNNFGFKVDNECFTRNRDGRLFRINNKQTGE